MAQLTWRWAAAAFVLAAVGAWLLLATGTNEGIAEHRAVGAGAVDGRHAPAGEGCKRCGFLADFRSCTSDSAVSSSCLLPLSLLMPTQITVGPIEKAKNKERLRELQAAGRLEDYLTEVQVPVLLGEGQAYGLGGAEWIAAAQEEAANQRQEWEVLVLVVANYDRVVADIVAELLAEKGGKHGRDSVTNVIEAEERDESDSERMGFLESRTASEGFWFWTLVKGDKDVASHMLLPTLELVSDVALRDSRGMGPFDPNEIPATYKDLHEDPFVDVVFAAIEQRHISKPRKSTGAGHRPLPVPRDLILSWAAFFRGKLQFPLAPNTDGKYEWCSLRPYDAVCWPDGFELDRWVGEAAREAGPLSNSGAAKGLPGFVL
mmetsp:Transcript_15779/g.61649  ORF Transcript_15779/g.61649 Transcript_15779/m.61649 type:complete len:375 (+) Transcript_15779:86-1210(+)